jgi:hypothetical protein
MKKFNLILLTSLIACSGNQDELSKNKKPASFLDTTQVYLDFYYLNRGFHIDDQCDGTRPFISADLKVKLTEPNTFTCTVIPDSCMLNVDKFNSNMINTLIYSSNGEVSAIKSGVLAYDDVQSFFKDRRSFDSVLRKEPWLSPFLRDYLLIRE